MRLVLRYPAPFLVVLSACATIAAVSVFARPANSPKDESAIVDFGRVRHYTPSAVRGAFAEQGIDLRLNSRFYGIMLFSRVAVPDSDALQVMVGPKTGQASWGPKLEPYDERFGNVLVTYGGRDEQLLARVKTAVSALR